MIVGPVTSEVEESIREVSREQNSAVTAIQKMDFNIDWGEFIGVMGESGSGKSTLLSIMGAMNAPTSGRLTIDDIDIYDLSLEKMADFRREFLGFVFQSFHLIPYLTVIENVMLPLATIKMPKKDKRSKAEEALESVGLLDKKHRLPSNISGGEKERVAIARAIVNEPPILLADEPTGNLDTQTSREIMALFQTLNQQGMTISFVTPKPVCRRILVPADAIVWATKI